MQRLIIATLFAALAFAFTPSAEAFHGRRGRAKRGLRPVGKVVTAPVRLLKRACH